MMSQIVNRNSCAVKEFEYILEKYVLPLIHLEKALRFVSLKYPIELNKHIISYADPKTKKLWLRFYPSTKKAHFYFRVEVDSLPRILPAAQEILRELMYACPYRYENPSATLLFDYDRTIVDDVNVYRANRYEVAFELGLCNWLGGYAIYRLLSKLKLWSQKTYEGKRVPFSFIVDSNNKKHGEIDYIRFMDSNHSAVFTDGISSGIALDNTGQIVKFFSTSEFFSKTDSETPPLAPHRFRDFCNMCFSKDGSTWVGMIEQTNGDILIFKNRELLFVKRNGEWKYLDSNRVIFTISQYISTGENSSSEKLRIARELYLSLLDTSFSRSGGCLAIINEDRTDEIRRNYISKDDLETAYTTNEKVPILIRLITATSHKKSFDVLDRKFRQEMLGLDGATVLDSSGQILGAGAIVKIDGGSDGGGRTAAAKQLACYGMAIKISMDGQITGYGCSETADGIEAKKLFSLL